MTREILPAIFKIVDSRRYEPQVRKCLVYIVFRYNRPNTKIEFFTLLQSMLWCDLTCKHFQYAIISYIKAVPYPQVNGRKRTNRYVFSNTFWVYQQVLKQCRFYRQMIRFSFKKPKTTTNFYWVYCFNSSSQQIMPLLIAQTLLEKYSHNSNRPSLASQYETNQVCM